MTDPAPQPTLDALESGGQTDLSLMNLLKLCEEVTKAINNLPQELSELTERELEKKVKPNKDHRVLKISFWEEFRRAQRDRTKPRMIMENIYHGVCARAYFYNNVIRNPPLLAWLVTPPTDEMLVQKELLRVGYKKLARVLSLPFSETLYKKDRNGEIYEEKRTNVGLIKEVRAIVEMLQNRVHGAVIQRAQNVNVNIGDKPPQKTLPAEVTLEQLDMLSAKLDKIEKARSDDVVEGEVEI